MRTWRNDHCSWGTGGQGREPTAMLAGVQVSTILYNHLREGETQSTHTAAAAVVATLTSSSIELTSLQNSFSITE